MLGGKRELLGGGGGGGGSSVGHVLKKSKDNDRLKYVAGENGNQFFTPNGCILYKNRYKLY